MLVRRSVAWDGPCSEHGLGGVLEIFKGFSAPPEISGPLGDHFAHANAGMTTSADLSAERAFQERQHAWVFTRRPFNSDF